MACRCVLGFVLLSIVVFILLGAAASPAAAHGGMYQPPTPVVPGTGTGPPSWKRTATPGLDHRATPVPAGLIHWSQWWYLHRESLLDLEGLRRRRRSGMVSGSEDEAALAKRREREEHLRRQIVRRLLESALSHDADVATGSVLALGRAGDPIAIPLLRKLTRDEVADRTIRESATLALGMFPDHATEIRPWVEDLLTDMERTPRERGFAALALGLLRNRAAVPVLAARVRAADETVGTRATAAFSLGLLGEALARPELGELLKDEHPLIRAHAAAAFARLGSATPALLRALSDPHLDVRRQAALSLAAIPRRSGDEEDLVDEALALAHLNDADHVVRGFAAIALGERGTTSRFPDLLATYRKGTPFLAAHGALGMGLLARNTDDEAVREKILTRLRLQVVEQENPDLLGALICATAMADGTPPTARLIEVLGTGGTARLRGHAATALGILGVRSALPAIRGTLAKARNPELLRECAFALGLLADREGTKILTRLLREEGTLGVRGTAASSLGRLGTPAATTALLAMLGEGEAPPIVRAFAAVGLGLSLEKKPVLGPLADHLNHGMVGPAIAEALTFF